MCDPRSRVRPDPAGSRHGIQAPEPEAWVRMAPSLRGFVIWGQPPAFRSPSLLIHEVRILSAYRRS